jgi:outer membrane murein-binding lipoprotein Lpp
MVRGKYVLLLLAVAAVAVTVPIAQGTTGAKDPRVTKLTKQVSALKTRVGSLESTVGTLKTDNAALKSDVATLKADVAALKTSVGSLQTSQQAMQTDISCVRFAATPVVLRGQASDDGYLFKRSGDTTNIWLYTAMDTANQGETPGAWLAMVNPSCLKSYAVWRPQVAPAREAYGLFGP